MSTRARQKRIGEKTFLPLLFLPGGEGEYDRKCTFERKTNGFGGKNIGQDNEVK